MGEHNLQRGRLQLGPAARLPKPGEHAQIRRHLGAVTSQLRNVQGAGISRTAGSGDTWRLVQQTCKGGQAAAIGIGIDHERRDLPLGQRIAQG